MAQGFLQSFNPAQVSSYPYSTPLGPLSPFGGSTSAVSHQNMWWEGNQILPFLDNNEHWSSAACSTGWARSWIYSYLSLTSVFLPLPLPFHTVWLHHHQFQATHLTYQTVSNGKFHRNSWPTSDHYNNQW